MSDKLLIVDDEPDILKPLNTILTDEGFYVRTALSGIEALEIFMTESFDLVITNIRMPGMDGLELISQIKQLNGDVEVIVLTGFATVENAIQALKEDRAFDYLTKPLEDIDDLIIPVSKALERRRLRQKNKSFLDKLKNEIEARKRTGDALKEAHDELESRVEARTKELRIKTRKLEELNSALKVLLKQREEDKKKLEDKVLINVKQLVLPNLDRLKKSVLDDNQKSCLEVLKSNLNEIISPFAHKLSSKYINLTPSEIQVADLVKQGMSSKEIAMFLSLSVKTIDRHRENIRKKIGLKDRKVNLRSYLLTLS